MKTVNKKAIICPTNSDHHLQYSVSVFCVFVYLFVFTSLLQFPFSSTSLLPHLSFPPPPSTAPLLFLFRKVWVGLYGYQLAVYIKLLFCQVFVLFLDRVSLCSLELAL